MFALVDSSTTPVHNARTETAPRSIAREAESSRRGTPRRLPLATGVSRHTQSTARYIMVALIVNVPQPPAVLDLTPMIVDEPAAKNDPIASPWQLITVRQSPVVTAI